MSDCSILDELNSRAYERCIPLNVTLELTLRCNIRCTHCYNFDRDQPRPASAAELSMPEIRTLLGDLRRAGTLFLTLTGGEAMAHPRFWEISEDALSSGFALQVLSNGTLLTEQACDRFAGYPGLWGVSLSVYGATAGTHDAVTQVPGSFERTMSGARRLRGKGVRTSLKFIVMKGNAAEVEAMIAMGDREGFAYAVDPTITGRYDGTSGSLATRVDAEELETLYRGPLQGLVTGPRPEPADDDFKCNCARGNAAVSSTGEVYPCIATPLRAGSIREQSFGEIWERSPVFQRIRSLKIADFPTCAPCDLKRWCRRTPGPAYLLTGDYTGVDPWACREAAVLKSLSPANRPA
ncbi:MAG: radical SAM protein [Planctomycetaceae bacterium]|nr:radical SAM protein [Planctomycetaceae bacterium]